MKALAILATLAVALVTLWLLVVGFGLIRLGIPPSGEELGRMLMFLLITIAYAGVWLALAMLFSIVFRSTATAALVALGLWLFLSLLWPALAQVLGEFYFAKLREERLREQSYVQAVHETGARLTHDVKNLFVVDGSVFVTSGGVNPTSTIQAIALYIADQMKQRLATLFD